MLTTFAGFTGPIVIIPLALMSATAVSLIIWLIWTVIQLLRHKNNPKYLFIKLLLASSVILTLLYFTIDNIKR